MHTPVGRSMTSIQIELPDKLAEALDTMVQQGWFRSEEEVLRIALLEFLRRHRLELHEQLQRDDIAWALRQAVGAPGGRVLAASPGYS